MVYFYNECRKIADTNIRLGEYSSHLLFARPICHTLYFTGCIYRKIYHTDTSRKRIPNYYNYTRDNFYSTYDNTINKAI